MNAGTREGLELGRARDKLVQKLEDYLRKNFGGDSVERLDREEVEKLLFDVACGWCANRGLTGAGNLAASACREALDRYSRNWEGKKQGEDDRSGALGRTLRGNVKTYGI